MALKVKAIERKLKFNKDASPLLTFFFIIR